jgi:hypothetical protein
MVYCLKKRRRILSFSKTKGLAAKAETEDASVHLKTLSGLFSNMDTIANLLTASLLMEPFSFNLHVLKNY